MVKKGWGKKGAMLSTGDARKYAQGNLVEDLLKDQNKADQDRHLIWYGSRDSGDRWVEGQICGDGYGKRPVGWGTLCDGSGGKSRWVLGGGVENKGEGDYRGGKGRGRSFKQRVQKISDIS